MSISKERLEEIRNFKNTDFSDCPVLTDEQLAQMKPCHLVNRNMWKPVKKSVTLRLDADVLDSLKRLGKGYQTKINEILRAYVSSSANTSLKQ